MLLEKSILTPAGYEVTIVTELQAVETQTKTRLPDLILISEKLPDGDGLELATNLLKSNPHVPVILLAKQYNITLLKQALRIGIADCLAPPVHPSDVLNVIERSLAHRKSLEDWAYLESRRNTKNLRRRIDNLEALQRVGRLVTASLDLDKVLMTAVDAAVELTGAEEGSLFLLDETTGELYIRAARNFQDDFVRTFQLPVHDSLAGQVLRTGKPITIDEKIPKKIKTSYLVHTLIYVPLQVHGHLIGVLGVDNRQTGHPFSEEHITLMSALADYAAIAIENAHLYFKTEASRNKLETILTKVGDGVIVVGLDRRLILINQIARDAFHIEENQPEGRPISEIFQNPELLEIFDTQKTYPNRSEITLDDGRVLSAQTTLIPDVGIAITMQDITHLKELDRIKTDFVHTVSHDLRSPLTSILGYVELIGRVGPITDQQREFVHRIRFSVHNITSLINDLLDLGRVEAGFDLRMEIVHLPAIINLAVEGLQNSIHENKQELTVDAPENLPAILGDPIRLRQMITNLLSNAIKFTQTAGQITIRCRAEAGLLILEVIDNGYGIPAADQPYIFDRFYRGGNIPPDTPGSGLGLAIVKSIVENHHGRIWLESSPSRGTTFTVVLPVAEQGV
jgi:two-component system NtrC family sensor kinase